VPWHFEPYTRRLCGLINARKASSFSLQRAGLFHQVKAHLFKRGADTTIGYISGQPHAELRFMA
jgi:hypothetical protein